MGRTRTSRLSRVRARLRRHALSYPEAHEEFPWGECVIKVRKKIFLFLGRSGRSLGLSVKLPGSAMLALDLPYATPTGYGLGKSGWVTAEFKIGDAPPLAMLEQWVDESYRAVAPKRLVAAVRPAGRRRRAPAAG